MAFRNSVNTIKSVVMEYLIKLFKMSPILGWGDATNYEGTPRDINKATSMLNGSIDLILLRASYNFDNENNPKKLKYNDWLIQLKDGDGYVPFLLKNYSLKNGEFEIGKMQSNLNKLAEKYLESKNL